MYEEVLDIFKQDSERKITPEMLEWVPYCYSEWELLGAFQYLWAHGSLKKVGKNMRDPMKQAYMLRDKRKAFNVQGRLC